MRHFVVLFTVALIAAAPEPAHARRSGPHLESLLQVVSPDNRGVAEAHPWVNVRVRVGTGSGGATPDITTFRARFGKCDVTDLFESVLSDGVVVEQRARLQPTPRCPFRTRKGFRNRLRFKIRAASDGEAKRRTRSDVDKVRFGVLTVENRPPVPLLSADAGALVAGVPLEFSAEGTHDPDGDWLTFDWDFGDGGMAAGPRVSHVYAVAEDVTVRLRVSDGQAEAGWERTFHAVPPLDPGRTPGVLRLSAEGAFPLEFGAVAVGGSMKRVFTVHNDSTDVMSSQIKFVLRLLGDDAPFEHDCASALTPCELGPGEQREIMVTFSPRSGGHADSWLVVVAAAANATRVGLLLHGYGGGEPVPWDTSSAASFLDDDRSVGVRQPDGSVSFLDTGTGACEGGVIDGSACITDVDCPGGGLCGARRCFGGGSDGAPCTTPGECDAGTCGLPFEPTDLCADGSGSVFLFSDFAHDDPDLDRDPAYSGWIVRARTDGTRAVLTDRVAEDSTVMACDGQANGRVFWAQYDLFGPDFEDEREQLRSVSKDGTGSPTQHVPDIVKRLGDADPESFIDPVDGYVLHEPTDELRVSADGTTSYVANVFGLYRLEPQPLLITRDVTGNFDLFPDGAILAVEVLEDDTEAELRLYRLEVNADRTPVSFADLTPWARLGMPSNRGPCVGLCLPSVIVSALTVAPDGNVFVSLFTRGAGDVLPPNLRAGGVVRFQPVSGGAAGAVAGFVSLETVSRLDF